MLAMTMGMKKGLNRSGPRVAHSSTWSMKLRVPPSPEPISTPVDSRISAANCSGKPAWFIASRVATSVNCV